MSSPVPLFAYINQQFVPEKDACLHIGDLAIQRGYGVFDFLRVQDGKPLFRDEYLERFFHSASLMDLTVPLSIKELRAASDELIARNHIQQAGIKMILTGGYSSNGYDLAEPNLILAQSPIVLPTTEQIERGIKIITHDYVREIPRAKTINYTMGIRLIKTVKECGADDVLYCHAGKATEFPRSSFFIVRHDGTIATAAEDVLLGITRKHVLELAAKRGQAEAGTISLDDLKSAREAFTTSTTKRILPIVAIDGKPIGDGKPGPITLALLEDLIEMEKRYQA